MTSGAGGAAAFTKKIFCDAATTGAGGAGGGAGGAFGLGAFMKKTGGRPDGFGSSFSAT